MVAHLGSVAYHHIEPAKEHHVDKVNRHQIPDLPGRYQEIQSAGNGQKADQNGEQKDQNLLEPPGIKQRVIESGIAQPRHSGLLKHGPHLQLQLPVVLPQLAGLVGDALLHSPAFLLLPLGPGFFQALLTLPDLLIIIGADLIPPLPGGLADIVRHGLFRRLQLPLQSYLLCRQLIICVLVTVQTIYRLPGLRQKFSIICNGLSHAFSSSIVPNVL